MISEDVVREALTAAAEGYPVPADGAERIIEAAAGHATPARATRSRRPALLAAAAASVVLAVGLTALGSWHGSPRPAGGTELGATTAGTGGATGLSPGAARSDIKGASPLSLVGGSAGVEAGAAPAAPLPGAGTAGGGGNSGAGPGSVSSVPVAGPRVVKTGSVDLTVGRTQVGPTLTRIESVAAGDGGYVASSDSQEGGTDPSGQVTLRVPAGQFESAVAAIRGLGKVTSAGESGQDVTAQYVDLGARISALQASRSTYLEILAKATTIGDILAVQQQIDAVQQQLEQLQGQQKLLGDQSDFGTLTVSVSVAGTAPAGPPSGLHKALDRALHSFVVGLEDLVAALGPLLLVLLGLAALALLARIGWRVTRRRLV
ncbi:MAG TPA: DUF4349 domain-containing protein [Mycobacteriales bacterium]|nr:DUF4349 domain-containing protein [Mycobacteriales bacterium]